MSDLLLGSICLSDIDKTLIKKVTLKSGETKLYLPVKVVRRKEASKFGDTHFIAMAVKREEQTEGRNYIIGDLKVWEQTSNRPSPEEIAQAPFATPSEDDLPF